MLDYMKTLMREERNMDPYAIYIYTLVINKYICFCQEHSIEIISHDSALQFFQSKILPLRYYGTQKLYCSPLKLFFQAHGVSLTLPKIHNKYRGLQHPRIMKDQEIERLMKYFSKEDKSIEPFIFHRNQLLFYIILQSAPMLSETNLPGTMVRPSIISAGTSSVTGSPET